MVAVLAPRRPDSAVLAVLVAALVCCLDTAAAVALLRETTSGRPVRVACVGASITEGYLATPGHDYPSQLQRLLGSGYEVRNFGVSGTTALRSGREQVFLAGFRGSSYWDMPELTDALAFLPDVVIVQFGANDSKDYNWRPHHAELMPDFASLLGEFQRLASHPAVHVMVPPPLYNDGVYKMNATVVNEVLPGRYRRLPPKLGLASPIEVFDVFQHHCPLPPAGPCDWMSFDGCHPNDEGYRQMALAAAAALQAGR
mmetsp:Transcript_50485/g.156209  ORF Transcript_50485/g.156209 Transcript_50485/m.156209 type:complete len:256 (+) Transcript_50485:79-846(+)